MMLRSSQLLKRARERAGLGLRELARLAGTSHGTLSAYESGRKSPNAETLFRLLDCCGQRVDLQTSRRIRGTPALSRGDELAQVLRLAAQFPARHDAELNLPIFPRNG